MSHADAPVSIPGSTSRVGRMARRRRKLEEDGGLTASAEASMQARCGEHQVGGTLNASSGPSRVRTRPHDVDR